MNEFLRTAYGDPCRGCGYEWSVEPPVCAELVSSAPARFIALLAGQEGTKACADLDWNAAAYVVHVADVLQLWAGQIRSFLTMRGAWVMSVATRAFLLLALCGHCNERPGTGRRPINSPYRLVWPWITPSRATSP